MRGSTGGAYGIRTSIIRSIRLSGTLEREEEADFSDEDSDSAEVDSSDGDSASAEVARKRSDSNVNREVAAGRVSCDVLGGPASHGTTCSSSLTASAVTTSSPLLSNNLSLSSNSFAKSSPFASRHSRNS